MKQPSDLAARRLATFGRRFDGAMLKAARIRAGLTEKQLSRVIYSGEGSRRSSIHNLESGMKIPNVYTLLRLCEVLRCRMDDIAPKLEART